ncbi:MAG TPA: ABC transporter ATP-binding protein [Gaiellaceae bacterium]|nr:ABC transporter ATP-binding protein [Gaiellaceae bacterium]
MSTRIEIRDLSKSYLLGAAKSQHVTLREELAARARRPFQRAAARNARDELWALSDVSFDVSEGDVVGVVGRNGAGKSTLLKILSRIVEPTRGEVRMSGRVTSLLEVGTGFHPELSGRENVQLNGALLGMSRKEIARRFDQIVEFSGVERFLDTPVKFYSSGMYVRLAFAVAAHLDPDILIVDEVLAVGDVGFQRRSISKMRDVAGEGRTVLFVSHNADSVRSLCSRGVHLSSGRVAAIGTVEDALASYHAELEGAVGAPDGASRRKADGSGGATIDTVAIWDGDGRPSSEFDSGDEIVIVISARVEDELIGQPLYLGLGVDSGFGPNVFTTFSSWQDTGFTPRDNTLRVACRIPSLGLVGGRYFVSASILGELAVLDGAPRLASFVVREPDGETLWPQRIVGHGAMRVECEYEELPATAAGVDPEVAA